eukprot:CAMPEP_0175298786 /NCGR_PEP_ID=MMETSP0093-20121207/60271_1 /TAXON_ID=311494 /ORGANISM="Alexandrium monilatum, Strain CCMP3105" /LENGTH=83 /DNA_ID=CAMNT_0016594919 /DNA_START=1 /DNA_END=248 /DNA_ORIENTATION=-
MDAVSTISGVTSRSELPHASFSTEAGQHKGDNMILRTGLWPGNPSGGGPPCLLRPTRAMVAADASTDGEGATVGGGVRTTPAT